MANIKETKLPVTKFTLQRFTITVEMPTTADDAAADEMLDSPPLDHLREEVKAAVEMFNRVMAATHEEATARWSAEI